MKKLWRRLALLVMIFSLLTAIPAFAQDEDDAEETAVEQGTDGIRGVCGDEIAWMLDGDTLTISGSGEMQDFEKEAPWAEYKDEIKKVVFSGSVTTVGAHSFEDYDNLKEVDFGSSMNTLGPRCLAFCDSLVRIQLPSTFRVFGFECLRSCHSLKAIHCSGGFPSFKESCLWDTDVKIYYPASNPWPVNLIEQLENAFSHQIEFVDSEGVDHWISGYEKTEIVNDEAVEERIAALDETVPEFKAPIINLPETTAPTEPETTEPETTVPETEAVTTEPETTQPETEPETEPETTEAPTVWETVAPTEPPARRSGGPKIGMMIVVIMLLLLAAGAILFRIKNGKRSQNYGRRY